MAEFRYVGKTVEGEHRSGVMTGADEAAVRQQLAALGITPTSLEQLATTAKPLTLLERLNTVPVVVRLFFTENLRVMIHAGLPIGRALQTLGDQMKHKTFKKVISQIRTDVEQGVTLSVAIAKYPSIFPRYYVAMVAAGEASGKLDDVFVRLSTQMKKEYALKGKIRNALIYPTIVLFGMVAVSVVMLVVVLPKITSVFEESGAQLPLPTRILIGASDFLRENGILSTGIAILLVAGFIAFRRSAKGRRKLDTLKLRFPILGPIVQKVNVASFSRSLNSLLSTDIHIVQTFQIIAQTMSNSLYSDALQASAEKLKTGASVVTTLTAYPRLFPPILTQMLSIGEESGSLDSIAGEVASFYEDEVDQTMANLSTILEPIIILVLGLGVVGVALAVILPIYSLSSQIG